MTAKYELREIVNMAYHSSIITVLTVGYSELVKKVLKKPPPKLDLNFSDLGMLSLDILAAMYTKEMLISKGIIPADIMK